MKTTKFTLIFLLSIGLSTFLLQGCYTRLAVIEDDEYQDAPEYTYYQEEDTTYQEEQPVDNQYYDDDYYYREDYWRPRNYVGFHYYYPSWRFSWGWTGCYYPSYWDPWWSPYDPYYGWSSYYSYYPYYSYWYPYYGYNYYVGHYSNHYYGTRNSGYQRGSNALRNTGVTRSSVSGSTEPGTINSRRTGAARSGVDVQNATTTGTRQIGASSTKVRQDRGTAGTSSRPAGKVTTGRASRSTNKSNAQQPRGQSSQRVERSRGTSAGSSRSSSSAPSYTPAPQKSSEPQSPPPSRSDDSNQRGGSSGRSRR
ncbi:MAG: hypothetical protein JXA06_03130 [Bacteroidetes bacterium]|nr:hypothetical protein [Bacteroidota bacterium]